MKQLFNRWMPRVAAFIVAFAAAASIVVWFLRVQSLQLERPSVPAAQELAAVDGTFTLRALGVQAVGAQGEVNGTDELGVTLLGLVNQPGRGAALFVGGGLAYPKVVRLNAEVVPGWALQSIDSKSVTLGHAGVTKTLSLPVSGTVGSMGNAGPAGNTFVADGRSIAPPTSIRGLPDKPPPPEAMVPSPASTSAGKADRPDSSSPQRMGN